MRKESKPINWAKVIKVKEEYELTNATLGALVKTSPSTINAWINSTRTCGTNLITHKKFDFLYRHFNSKHKWLIKILVRFI